jgi:hypothetical protein
MGIVSFRERIKAVECMIQLKTSPLFIFDGYILKVENFFFSETLSKLNFNHFFFVQTKASWSIGSENTFKHGLEKYWCGYLGCAYIPYLAFIGEYANFPNVFAALGEGCLVDQDSMSLELARLLSPQQMSYQTLSNSGMFCLFVALKLLSTLSQNFLDNFLKRTFHADFKVFLLAKRILAFAIN